MSSGYSPARTRIWISRGADPRLARGPAGRRDGRLGRGLATRRRAGPASTASSNCSCPSDVATTTVAARRIVLDDVQLAHGQTIGAPTPQSRQHTPSGARPSAEPGRPRSRCRRSARSRRPGRPPGTCRSGAGCGPAPGTARCRRSRWRAACAPPRRRRPCRRSRWCRRPGCAGGVGDERRGELALLGPGVEPAGRVGGAARGPVEPAVGEQPLDLVGQQPQRGDGRGVVGLVLARVVEGDAQVERRRHPAGGPQLGDAVERRGGEGGQPQAALGGEGLLRGEVVDVGRR